MRESKESIQEKFLKILRAIPDWVRESRELDRLLRAYEEGTAHLLPEDQARMEALLAIEISQDLVAGEYQTHQKV